MVLSVLVFVGPDRVRPVGSDHAVARGAAGEEVIEVVEHAEAHRLAGLARGAAQMRQHHEVVALHQIRCDAGFAIENVQRGAADRVEHQRLCQGPFIDDFTARGVDQESIFLHQVEPARVDQVPVLRAAGTVQGHEIALRQKFFDRVDLAGIAVRQNLRCDRAAVLNHDVHAEAVVRAFGHFLSDAPIPDDPQRLAGYLGAYQVGRAPAGPLTGAQFPLALAGPPGNHQHQRHRDVGSAFAEHVRRIGDGQAEVTGGTFADVAVANAVVADDPCLRPGHFQRLGAHLVGDRGQDRVETFQGVAQVGGRERFVGAVEGHVVVAGQLRFDGLRPAAGDENGGFHHDQAAFPMTRATVSPMTAGFSATVTPTAERISTFSEALSPKAEMIAPA